MKANWFVAIPVPAGQWFAPLVRTVPERVRVFHPEDIHLTVAFLGSCGAELAGRAWEQVRHHEGPVFPVVLGNVAPMGNPRRPSALSVVIEHGHEAVAELIGTLRGPAFEAAKARPERRPPLPHITVARLARKANAHERAAAIAWARSRERLGEQVTLERLALYTWADDRRVRQFQIVEQIPLSPSAP